MEWNVRIGFHLSRRRHFFCGDCDKLLGSLQFGGNALISEPHPINQYTINFEKVLQNYDTCEVQRQAELAPKLEGVH